MAKNVLIIGGGIIGLSTAYYLQKEGYNVTIIDKSNIEQGASFVNAGFLTPSHIIPLASPGMMAKGIKYMFNSSSPFYMKPRLDLDFIKWSWYFHKSSTKAKVETAIPLIKDINLLSKDLYIDIFNSGDLEAFQLEKKGLLMLYKTTKEGLHEKQIALRAAEEGLETSELTRSALDQLQPNLHQDIQGAVHYKCDAHTTPNQYMSHLKKYLIQNGVLIKTNERVIDFRFKSNNIDRVITNKEDYQADQVVLATGSWSQDLGKKLGLKIPIQAGKGYCINVQRETNIVMPSILLEAKVAVTPMHGFYKVCRNYGTHRNQPQYKCSKSKNNC